MLVADIEHGESLIDTDDPAGFQPLRHRPSHSTGARRQVENLFIALQREHIGQFLGQIVADLRGPAVKLSGMLRVMKARLVIVCMPLIMTVAKSMLMAVPVLVAVLMFVVIFVAVMMTVIVFVFFAHFFTVPSIIFRRSLPSRIIDRRGKRKGPSNFYSAKWTAKL
jgi:fatty acid desaturase